jgi:hypothetical protein
MEVADFVTPATAVIGLRAKDKHQLLDEIARRAATALGSARQRSWNRCSPARRWARPASAGLAIPHARIAGLRGSSASWHGWSARSISRRSTISRSISLPAADAGRGGGRASAGTRLPVPAPAEKGVADRLRAARDSAALYAALTGAQSSGARN